ncbi:MAG: hypothetical protein ACJ79R_14145 [Anaeromyxobacteraceae bacterium]
MRAFSLPTVAVLAALSTACGGATAKLKLRNDTPGAAAQGLRSAALASSAPVTPSFVGVKLLAVYLAEDVDPRSQDNVGRTSMIWVNAQCADDISGCNVEGAAGDYPHRVSEFFDLAVGSDAVNAALNSQGRPVDPGTYRYVRMEFCKMQPGEVLAQPNVAWQTPALPARRAFAYGACGVTSRPFETPLTLAAGDAVSVTVAYDLSTAVVSGTPSYPGDVCFGAAPDWVCYADCVDDAAGGTRTCFNPPEFTPSAAKGL